MVEFKKSYECIFTGFAWFLIVAAAFIVVSVFFFLGNSPDKYTWLGFALTYAILAISIFSNQITNNKLDSIEILLKERIK